MAAMKATKTTGDPGLATRKRELIAVAPTPADIRAATAKARPAKAAPKVEPTAKLNGKPSRQENPPRPLGTTPETYACRAADCPEPNLAPTHADGLCAKHRAAYHDNTWRLTASGMRKLAALRAPGASADKPRVSAER